MNYGDAVWTGDGWLGRVCADPDCTVILHETADTYPTEHDAEYVAHCEWSEFLAGETEEQNFAPPHEDAA